MSRYAQACHHVSVVVFQSDSNRKEKKKKGKKEEKLSPELAERTEIYKLHSIWEKIFTEFHKATSFCCGPRLEPGLATKDTIY